MRGGAGGGDGGEVWHLVGEGRAPDIEAIRYRLRPMRSVDDELDIARADGVHAMRPAFQHLIH